MPTIKDIAREAGVSHGTVSNVLNKTGKVSIEKIRLVEAAAVKLGYVPNTQAQLLRQGGKKMIAIILPTLEVARYRDLYDSLRRLMVTAEYEVGLYITEDICAYEEKILEQLPVSRLDAIITISCLAAPEKAYQQSCPVVYVDRLPQSAAANRVCIAFDFKQAGKEMAAVFSNSCKKLAFFSNSSRFSDDSLIYEGALEQLAGKAELKKFSCDSSLIINKAFEILSEDDFDGIIATTLNRGNALATACQYSHKKTPVIIPMESLGTFPVSNFPVYELNYGLMGKNIGNMLISQLEKGKPLPAKTIVKNDGFRFRFPFIHKASEKKSLSMLTLVSPATAALEKLLPDFEALTNIKLNLTALSYEDLYEHIGLITKSDFYDLIRMDVAWLSSLAPDTYRPLKETGRDFSAIKKNLLPDSLPYYSCSGGLHYSLPFDPSYQVLLYRKDLFADATLKRAYYEKYHEHLTVPKDFHQYNRIAAFFTKSQNSLSPIKYGATLTYGSAATASCDYLPRLLCYNQDFIDSNGRLRIDTPAAREALDNYRETYQYSSKTENSWWFHSVKEFSDGQAAMTITFSNHASSIVNSKQSNVVGKAGTAIVPGGVPLLGGGVIGISKNSKNINECSEFFKWFYSSEIASAFTLLGGLSPHMDIYKNSQLTNLFPWLEQSLESFQIGRRSIGKNAPAHYELKKFEYILGTAVKNVVNGTMDAKAALHYAQSLYDIQF